MNRPAAQAGFFFIYAKQRYVSVLCEAPGLVREQTRPRLNGRKSIRDAQGLLMKATLPALARAPTVAGMTPAVTGMNRIG